MKASDMKGLNLAKMQIFSKSPTRNYSPKLVKNLPIAPHVTNYYTGISNNNKNKFQLFNMSEDVVKKPCLA